MTVRLLTGDCRQVLKTLPDASVDACVTDPPYELGFMGKAWDSTGIASNPVVWSEVLRVLKPGAYLLAFGGTRTYHRLACAIEDAGFEIRDQVGWLFGSGFPKSHNGEWGGTALKPAWEPICMARKPLIGTVDANWREHGTGALNIDGCRVAGESWGSRAPNIGGRSGGIVGAPSDHPGGEANSLGRWPANLMHDGSEEVIAAFPTTTSVGHTPSARGVGGISTSGHAGQDGIDERKHDTGSAARFFWSPKASRADRNEGLQGMPERETKHYQQTMNNGSGGLRNGDGSITPQQNHHPTVKPTDLMRYLCRLVTPPGGTVLDPFAGSGSTLKGAELEGFKAIGIELDPAYVEIARRRIAADAPLFAEVAC
jgi:DNA modification methylase